MKRTATWTCAVLLATMAVHLAAQQAAPESKPVTLTATVAAIDKATRVVTLKGPTRTVNLQASDQMQGFNDLKVGDQVSATYYEAVVLRAVRPGGQPSASAPTTIVTRRDRAPGSDRRREQNLTVVVEEIDMQAPSVRVRGPQGSQTFALTDPKQFQGVKVGDTVELTYYESLLVEVARPKKD